jgi:lipopolysaccharide heptosyltransferase I
MASDPAAPRSILIVRMSAFGDIICALPTLRALRQSFPTARIGWVVDERFADLLRHEPAVDDLIVVPLTRLFRSLRSPANWPRVRRELRALRQQLRNPGFDVSLDLQGILKSGFITRLAACPRNLQMAGDHLGNKQWLFPGERIPERGPHAVDRMLPLAAALGADISHPRFDFTIPDAARRWAEEAFAAHDFSTSGPVVALVPGAFAPHRIWPAERFAAAAARLHKDLGARMVVLGGPKEVDLAQRIVEQSRVPALCTAGKTGFLELAAVLERCDVVISGDTGPMHLAVAVGKPVVALFGPANPERTGPYGPQHIVLQKSVACGSQPCYAHPTCRDFACMKAIEVDEVVAAVARLLG